MRLALIAVLPAMLTACGDAPEPAGPERAGAAGEVLGGEVSDAMLPLESVQSTSPVDPRAAATGRSTPGAPATPQDDEAAINSDAGPLPTPQVSGGPDRRQSAGIVPTSEPTPE